jgi:predicted anti-sigma-YlaC factor YlaD
MRWRRGDLVCRQAVALATDYIEDALSRGDKARFERHLAGCPHCSEYFEQMRTTIRALGKVEPETLSPEARADLIDLYRRYRSE